MTHNSILFELKDLMEGSVTHDWADMATPTFMRKVLAFVLRRMTISSQMIPVWLISILGTLKPLTKHLIIPGRNCNGKQLLDPGAGAVPR